MLNIKGVGEKTAQKLLTKFGSVTGIKNAGIEEIKKEVGTEISNKIFNHFDLHQLENKDHEQS